MFALQNYFIDSNKATNCRFTFTAYVEISKPQSTNAHGSLHYYICDKNGLAAIPNMIFNEEQN